MVSLACNICTLPHIFILPVAYEVLSDKQTRRIYDQSGEAGLERHKKKSSNSGGGHDPFSFFNGFGFGGSGRRNQDNERGSDIVLELPVTLAEL